MIGTVKMINLFIYDNNFTNIYADTDYRLCQLVESLEVVYHPNIENDVAMNGLMLSALDQRV